MQSERSGKTCVQHEQARHHWRRKLAAGLGVGVGVGVGVGLGLALLAGGARAQSAESGFPMPDMGRVAATAGVSQVEGAAGGGLTPWAVIAGYGTRDSYGGNVHATYLPTQDYTLKTWGLAVGLADRVELSLARQVFTGSAAPLESMRIDQDIVGAKVRLWGNVLYDQATWLPQVAVGAMFKHNNGITGLGAVTSVTQLGAARTTGVDYYLSATKLLLAQSLLLNGTVRLTKANQMGLLGFGGDLHDTYQPMLEASAAYVFSRQFVAGVEYRMKPRNLSADPEKDYYDAFIAWVPGKHLSVTLAWVALGDITVYNTRRQNGAYVSVQAGF